MVEKRLRSLLEEVEKSRRKGEAFYPTFMDERTQQLLLMNIHFVHFIIYLSLTINKNIIITFGKFWSYDSKPPEFSNIKKGKKKNNKVGYQVVEKTERCGVVHYSRILLWEERGIEYYRYDTKVLGLLLATVWPCNRVT